MMKWVRWILGGRVSSWHREAIATADSIKTLCGRYVPSDATSTEHAGTLDLNDKSCETCLRLEAR